MKFPFVSRARFDDKDAQLAEAKQSLAEMTRRYDVLDNLYCYRASGTAKDPELLPSFYRPAKKPETASDVLNDPKEPESNLPRGRQRLHEVEAKRMELFLAKEAK